MLSYLDADKEYIEQSRNQYSLDQKILASLVGAFAVGLPSVTMTSGLIGWTCFYNSVSHFYYSQFLGDVFVGVLVFIFCFMFAYRGESWWETRIATFGGFASLGIALFPTIERGCEDTEVYPGRILVDLTSIVPGSGVDIEKGSTFFSLFTYVEILHYGAALSLFLILAVFCLKVFTRTYSDGSLKSEHYDDTGTMRQEKALRNRIYRVAGWVILGCIAALGIGFVGPIIVGGNWDFWEELNVTFWFEAAALCAFGVAWIVKGRFFGLLLLDPGEKAKFGRATAQ